MVSKNNYQLYQQKHVDGKQRWGIRKLSVGVASVLLGTTFMLYGNHAVLADTVTSPSDDVTRSTTTQGGNKDKVTEGTTEGTTSTPQTSGDSTDKGQGKTLTETPTGTDKQANGQKVNQQVPTTDTEEATNHQDTPQGQNPTQVQDTTQNTTNVDKKDTEVTPANDATTPTTQNTTNVDKKDTEVTPTNDAKTLDTQKTPAKFTPAKFKVRAARLEMNETTETTSVVNPTRTDPTTNNNEEVSTSLPMSNQDIKLDSQPMLTEIINKPTDNWVYKNLKWYADSSTAKVKEILQNYTTNDKSGRYYFAGAANYNESYHVIYLLARSNNLNDNNLYVTILHTGRYKTIQEEVVAPGESKKVEYGNGTGGTTHAPIFTNYDGTSVSIGLDGVEKGDNNYGMVVGFAYGHDTGISGDQASIGNGFMTTPMPTKTTTTIHYIDQATGDELAVPKSFEGVAYQKYTITGEAPTIDGYTLKQSPKTTGYISPYKVGGSYDFRLDKHVVIKQTVINSQGFIRVTAYYDGEAINSTTRYLGNMSNVNDRMSFISHGKWYTYINQITSTNDGIVYYYAKDSSEDKSEVRVHYIDVTGNKNSIFVPGDGEEVATDKISGKLGENYNYNVKLPTDYNLATNQANTVNGTYTIDHHDEYVYVVKKTSAEKTTPKVPASKEPVANTSSLTETEKAKVQKNVEDANKGNFPDGTTVTVGDDGTATINYPDTSSETIPGSDLVRPATDDEKTTPKVPASKEPVANTSSLTETEKAKVQKNVEDANKGNFPDGTTVTVGDDGTATINYPDTTTDTIEGSKLVRSETDAEKITPNVPTTKEPVADPSHLTDDEKKQVKKNVEDANKDKFPADTEVTVGDDGTVTITYPDQTKSTDTIPGSDLVRSATDAEKITPNVPTTKEPVADPSHLTDDEKKQVKKNVEDANKDKFLADTEVTVGDDGTATVTYPDTTTDTIEGSKLVRPATDADKITPNVPTTKEPVADPSHLTDDEKKQVKKNVEDANKGNFPDGTVVTVGDDGTATINYPDTTTDTIEGSKLVRSETDAEKITPNVPTTKEPVADPSHLTDDEKKQVKKNVEDANKDKFPADTEVTVGDDGTATITYPDQTKSTDTIPGSDLVRPETDAEKITPNVPATKEPVADPSHLTDDEKKQVKKNVEDANKDKFPADTEVTVGDDGTVTITYPDQTKSTDTIPGSELVRSATDAEKITPNVPTTKEPVADPSHLTDDEKKQVKKNVEDANKDKFLADTEVTVGDDGTATVTYPDTTTDTIEGSKLVRPATDADKITPNVPTTKEPVADPSHLTDDEKKQVKKNVEDANKDKFLADTEVTVGDDGTATVTYPDTTTDTIEGSKLVRPATDADKITPNVPTTKEPVADPSHLTDDEKKQVKKNVEDANKDKFPADTEVTVGDDGTATITYPDQTKSTDTIPGSDLVRPETDADKITPNVPATKEPVADPSHLTDDEKKQVKKNVEDANKDKFPADTEVTVGDDGTVTITYPDQTKSTDTIPGSDLVRSATDAEKITPNVPTTKEPVADPSHLTDDEKKQVKKNVEDANKDKFLADTEVTVGDDGTATVTYPDTTTDTIEGSKLVRPATDADKITPNVPTTKEPVADPSHLTDDEKKQVKKNVEDANKDKFPADTEVTVGDDGTATITYPDQTKSTDTIPGSDLVRPETDAEKITPNVPATKEPVADPSHLTDDEKKQVKKNVEDANKDKFPADTEVTVGDDGTATITYPDQTKSTDTIEGSELVRSATDAEKITPNVPTTKEPVADPSHLTDDEKKQVKKNVEDANKDKFLADTEVTVGDDGTATVTYPDTTTDTIEGSKLVRPATDADKITPNVPTTKEPVADPSHLTDDEKKQVKKNVEDANKGNFPDGTTVTVGDDGTATINYPDTTTDTIEGSKLVRSETDAEKITPNVPTTKEPVADPSHLTDDEKKQVKKNVEDANKGNFPDGTEVTVGDDGTATITYPDQTKSTDTIPGSDLVRPETDAEKITPNVPTTKEPVADPSHLTDDEKKQVKKNVEDANKDKFPADTEVTVGDDGTATITYPDKSVDSIPGNKLVEEKKNSAENLDPTVSDKTKVDDPTKLTNDEKKEVEDNIRDNNPGLPEGTKIDVGDNGDTTITYPDKSVDTISGDKLVEEKNSAENLDPTVPAKTKVDDPTKLTNDEKKEVEDNIRDNNSGLPEGTKINVGDNGDTTITYPDKSVDTIPGNKLVEEKNSAEKPDPTVKAKTKIDDPTKLTNDEKKEVEDNIRDNNPGLPEGTKIDVGDNGDTTITYPDKSVVTILGNKLVEEKNSAEKLDPTVPAKTKVDDPTKLTNDEKKEVEDKVTEANKDKFPEGTEVTVDDDGTVTINYPDGSQDTIPGDQVVEAKTDADKTNPTVPGAKVEVKDPNNPTDEEKQQVKESIENANKDQFPEGTQVTIGNDGTATITYPDGSQDVIPGSQLVTKQGSDVANTGDVKNNGQGTTASIQGATADTTEKKLPQTGEQDTSATAATGLGLIILSLLGLFGLGSKKRKED